VGLDISSIQDSLCIHDLWRVSRKIQNTLVVFNRTSNFYMQEDKYLAHHHKEYECRDEESFPTYSNTYYGVERTFLLGYSYLD
jgi:hypothetical protein